MASASTILNLAWNTLRVNGSSTDVPGLQETTMLAVLNQANAEWKRTFRRSGEPPKLFAKETAFDIKAPTTLASDQASGATTAVLTSASDFDTAGAYVVYDDGMPDVQENTGKSSNTLSGVTGSDWAHESGDQVIKLYALPSNFHSLRSTANFKDGVEVNNTPYNYVPDDPKGGEFSIYDNGTKYLWFPRGLSGSCRVFYNKTSTTIDGTNDTVDVPEEYEWFLVYRLVAHGHRARGDMGLDIPFDQLADKILREAQVEKNATKIARTRPINPHRSLTHDDYYRLVTRE